MSKKPEVETYKGKDGLRWRVRHPNGRILANGGQGYSRRIDLMRGMEAAGWATLRHALTAEDSKRRKG